MSPQHFTLVLMALPLALDGTEVTAVLAKHLTATFSTEQVPRDHPDPPSQLIHHYDFTAGAATCHHSAPDHETVPLEPASLLTELLPHQRDSRDSVRAFGGIGKSCQETKDLETKHAVPNPAARALPSQYSSPRNASKMEGGKTEGG